ncbi:MAG: tetratricopeptide repeat protein [Candidatus Omnitrophica bacterium]|nr:tetratricopeptide repeat protein [Candidatus Omnitrophota bacterium]
MKNFLNERPWVFPLLLLGFAALLFGRVIGFDFINWDDNLYVYENPLIRSFSFEYLQSWFFRPFVRLYVPMPLLSFAVDYQIWGAHAGGYHFTNLAIHLTNMLLVYFLFFRIFKNPLGAFLGALLFAIHPVQVEAVAWISERKTLLFTFFALWVCLLSMNAKEKRSKTWVLIFFLFAASLLSKPMAVTIPLLVILYNFFYGEETAKKSAIKIFLILFVPVIVTVTLTLSLYPEILKAYHGDVLVDFFLLPWINYLSYLELVFFPVDLRLFYPPVDLAVAGMGALVLFFALTAAFILPAIRVLKEKRKFVFWILWFVISLAPVATLFKVPVGDRHLYFSILGIIGFVLYFIERFPRPVIALLAVLNLACIPLTVSQLSVWRNSETLWTNILKKDPANFRALVQLADYYQGRGRFEEAIQLQRVLIEYFPDDIYPYINLSNLLLAGGRVDEVKPVVELFAKRHSNHPELWVLKAAVAHFEGDAAGAEGYLKKALEINPHTYSALTNLGKIYLDQGRFSEAKELLQKAENGK